MNSACENKPDQKNEKSDRSEIILNVCCLKHIQLYSQGARAHWLCDFLFYFKSVDFMRPIFYL